MKRQSRLRPSRRNAFIYACALIALLVYGVPRIPTLTPGLAGTFSMLWILFVGLALAANIYFFVGADKERSRMLEELETEQDLQAEGKQSEDKRSLVSR